MFDELAEGFELFRPTCGLCKGPCPPQRESRAVANFVVCVDCDGAVADLPTAGPDPALTRGRRAAVAAGKRDGLNNAATIVQIA